MGGRQAERVRDCHSRGRREFLYQREGWTSPLRGFLAARIFLLHRKKVSGVTGARQPRHFRSLHGRLRRVASRLPPSATLQRRQRAQRRARLPFPVLLTPSLWSRKGASVSPEKRGRRRSS